MIIPEGIGFANEELGGRHDNETFCCIILMYHFLVCSACIMRILEGDMPRPLNDSPFLYGLHDPGGEGVLTERNMRRAGSSSPRSWDAIRAITQGHDYSSWANRGFGVIARLNNGYSPEGTIPNSSRYAPFAQRCANFVAASPGCHIWIIGNEPNLPVERPGIGFDGKGKPTSGEVIVPRCMRIVTAAAERPSRNYPGHAGRSGAGSGRGAVEQSDALPGNTQGDWVPIWQTC